MRMLSLIVVPAAFVLTLASTASAGQDKENPTNVGKPLTTLSKAAKHASKPATVAQDAMAKTVKQGSEKRTPLGHAKSPVSERSYEGCQHAKDSDA